MNYQEFITEVRQRISTTLGGQVTIRIHTSYKNNNTQRIGLLITDPVTNMAPTIYLEEYFSQYKHGNTMDNIIADIIELYQDIRIESAWNISDVLDFRKVQNRISYKLISHSKNQHLLSDIPHLPYLDLDITFYILIEDVNCQNATIPITNSLVKLWNTNVETLFQLAQKNSPFLLPYDFSPLNDVIRRLLGESDSIPNSYTDTIMSVLTNSIRTFGAACILYDNLLSKIGETLQENYFILPSSIHEVIIVPESQSPKREEIDSMIREINETQIAKEEVLSDHAYYFNRTTNTLS